MSEPQFSVALAACIHRQVDIKAWGSIWNLAKCPDPKIDPQIWPGDALISRSRCRAATHFLKNTDHELLFFLDDDIEISAFDATRMLWAAHDNKYPILGAPYALKDHEKGGFAFSMNDNNGQIKMGKSGGIIPVNRISSGCMIIRRDVFNAMLKKEKAHFCRQGYYTFFQHHEQHIDGDWDDLPEDWWFCKQAKDIGFGVFMDTRVKLNHWGAFPYNWDLVKLLSNGGIPRNEDLDLSYDVK